MTKSASTPTVAGVVLAGGLSRRMGADKALIDLAGRSLIDHVVGRFRPQVAALAINANGDASRFAQFGLPVLPDPMPGFQGPLAGILAGLQWAQQSGKTFVASVPADTPFTPANLVPRLLAGIGSAEIAVAASDDGRDHPTVALWRVSLANDLAAWLARGGDRAVHAWIRARRAVHVAFADGGVGDPFFNVNTPADLERAVERLKREQA
jgi:molybdopterin-guanine dinucleotide biosynthesis protein A